MNEREQNLVKIIIKSFSEKLKPLVEDFIIRENKAFVTLKASNYKDAKHLEVYKKECEEILQKKGLFEEVFVTADNCKLFPDIAALKSTILVESSFISYTAM